MHLYRVLLYAYFVQHYVYVCLNVSSVSPKVTCSSVGAYLGDSDVTVECAVRAKPPPTTLFWIVDANGTIVSDKEVSPNRLVVNKVTPYSLSSVHYVRNSGPYIYS